MTDAIAFAIYSLNNHLLTIYYKVYECQSFNY